jgi:hypothetical protein
VLSAEWRAREDAKGTATHATHKSHGGPPVDRKTMRTPRRGRWGQLDSMVVREWLASVPMQTDSLWTPAARQLSHFDRSCLERGRTEGAFLCAVQTAEVLIKLHTVAALALLTSDDPPLAQVLAHQLSRADGLGSWESALRRAIGGLARVTDRVFDRTLIVWLTQKTGREDADNLAAVSSPIANLCATMSLVPPPARQRPTPMDLLHSLVEVRNKTIGHGAYQAEFYGEHIQMLTDAVRWLYRESPLWRTDLLFVLDRSGSSMARVFKGSDPSEVVTVPDSLERGELALGIGEDYFPLPSLIRGRALTNSVYLANGGWRDADGDLEFLDYASSDRTRFDMPKVYADVADLKKSHTEGLSGLVAGESETYNNLPPSPDLYVSREALEGDLRQALLDRRRRHIVTLRGIGGIGKTALALHVSHSIARSEEGFGAILWMSARDIDLTLDGPVDVRRSAGSVDEVARRVCELLGEPASEGEELSRCAGILADESFPVLLVLDNFETFDDPHESYLYFDSACVPPCKVLITTRHEGFRGDYEIPVVGMSRREAAELLRSTARRFNREPLMTDEAVGRIYEYTHGHAYAMKLIASKASSISGMTSLMDSIMRGTDLLEALFRRSTEDLDDDAAFVFLLLSLFSGGLSEPSLVVAAKAQDADLGAGIADLSHLSLIEVGSTESSHTYRLPVMAQRFGRTKMLVGHPLRGAVETEADYLRRVPGLVEGDLSGVAAHLVSEAVLARATGANSDRALASLEALAELDGSMWIQVARGRRSAGRFASTVEDALRRAIEFDPGDRDVLLEWASLPGVSEERSIQLKVEAISVGECRTRFVSDLANEVNAFLRRHGQKYPRLKRAAITAPIIEALRSRFDELDGRDLSRLAWLCFNEGRTDLVDEIISRGLDIDPENEDIRKLALRTRGLTPGDRRRRRP